MIYLIILLLLALGILLIILYAMSLTILAQDDRIEAQRLKAAGLECVVALYEEQMAHLAQVEGRNEYLEWSFNHYIASLHPGNSDKRLAAEAIRQISWN